jgi:MFS family permease
LLAWRWRKPAPADGAAFVIPSPSKPYFAGLSRDTFLLALASLFADISTEMLYPILPVFLTDTLKAGGSIVGLVDGAAQATQNLVQGLSGALSDKLQRRKPIALAGYLLAAIAKPLIGLATVWQGALGARLLDRLGASARSAPRDALIAASADAEARGRAFGLEGLGDNAGACLGPLLAVFLLYALHIGLRPVFYLTIIPGLLAFIMMLRVREQPIAVPAKAKIDLALRRLPRGYWRYLLATAAFGVGNFGNAFLILRTRDIGAALETTILVYAGFNLAAALSSYPAGLLSDSWGRRNLLVGSLAILCIAYLGLARADDLLLAAAMFIFCGFHQGIFRAVGKALAADLAPQQLRAGGIGWYSTTLGLLQLVASLIAGLLWDRVGHAAVFYYGAAFAALGGIALLLLVPQRTGHQGTARG